VARYVPDSSLRTACPPSFHVAPRGASSNYGKTSVFVVGKTTVCRIFNCQRASMKLQLPAIRFQLLERPISRLSDFALRLHRTSRRVVPRRASSIFSTHDRASWFPAVAHPRVSELLSLRSALARCKHDRKTCLPAPLPEASGWRATRSSFGTLPAHLRAKRFGGQPSCIHERRLENTGLEPVTSWLQTRRSPS
jgi:hypothetical protein